ncbi:hypothetical protein FSP39_019632 [Pinctada imbricata]|uniref:Transmembrane protein 180 n=1 Tax=Pinctada imbricata TaxID=66713 RepID=A0AA88XT58_PINIB|nr:hypothetical protein FSP39_019632 [Pinctada imbricata]
MRLSDHDYQILAYCACSMGFSLISGAFGFYYVKVFLNFYHIEEKWFQTAQVLFMIWNAINDPLFAYCQDNFQTRFTRTRRHSILYGAPLFALSFLVPWFSWGSHPVTVGLHLIVTLFFWDTMFTFIGLTVCCLFTEISQNENDRYKLTRWSQVASLLGSSSVFVLEHTSNSLNDFGSFQMTTILIAFCSWLLMHYCGRNCHTMYDLEQMKSNGSVTVTKPKATSDGQIESYCRQTCQILRDRNFISFVITNFFQEFHKTFLSNFMAIICDQLISTEQVPLKIRSTFYGSISICAHIMLIVFMPWIAHFSYFRVIRASFIWKIGAGITMFSLGQWNPWILMVFLLLDSCFCSATFSLFNMPLSDIADENMRRYNRKHPISSMIFGTNALVVKPAISLSPMLVVSILNNYGYDRIKKDDNGTKLSPLEMEGLKSVMFHLICVYPIVIGTIQFIVWSFYSIRGKKRTVTLFVEGQE